jgi:hypothetical protein
LKEIVPGGVRKLAFHHRHETVPEDKFRDQRHEHEHQRTEADHDVVGEDKEDQADGGSPGVDPGDEGIAVLV